MRVEVRVGVLLGDAAVRGPARVADAGRGRARRRRRPPPSPAGAGSAIAPRAGARGCRPRAPTRSPSPSMHGDAGGVVAAVLELASGPRAAAPATGRLPTYPTMPHMAGSFVSDAEPRAAAVAVRLDAGSCARRRAARTAAGRRSGASRRRSTTRDEARADRRRPPPRSAPRPSRARAARCRSGARARGRGPRARACSRSTAASTAGVAPSRRRGRRRAR